jgi:hypothetical protein
MPKTVVVRLLSATVFGIHPSREIKVTIVPLSVFGLGWGVSSKPSARRVGGLVLTWLSSFLTPI